MDPIPPIAGAALGLAFLVLGALLNLKGGRGQIGAVLGAASAAIAVLVAGALSGVQVTARPTAFRDWTHLALLASVPLAWLASHGAGRALAARVMICAILMGLFVYPTAPLHDRYWDGRVALHVAGLTLISWLAVEVRWLHVSHDRASEGMLAFALAAVGAAPTLGFTGTGISAVLAGALAGAAGLFGLAVLVSPALRSAVDAMGVPAGTTQAVALIGVLTTGALYAETPAWSAATLALAPSLALLPGAGLRGCIIRLTLVAAAAATPAVAAYFASSAPTPYG